MLFTSIDFLIFFPIVLLVYFVMPSKIRYVWLLIASYFFYICWNPFYAILLTVIIGITYIGGLLLQHRRTKTVLISGIILSVGLLFFFKYTNFLLSILNEVLAGMHMDRIPDFDILLPIGISFYTFQALGYLLDVYRGNISAEKNILKYALFIAFFPQLLEGPIERSGNLLRQIQEEQNHKVWNYDNITTGFTTMLWGFFLKLVIADRIAVIVNTVFEGYEQYQMTGLVIGAVCFAIQIYCDFAGYSTIAIGAAKVLGFDLIDNFNTPYLASGIVDFWKRWHISLTAWLRDYIYIPLGGSRCSRLKKNRNILITFLVSGIWHGANWTYIVWGLLHGIYQIVEKELQPIVSRLNSRLHTRTESFGYRAARVIFTFLLVDFAWIFFRASSVSQAFHYIQRMLLYRDWWSIFDGQIYSLGLEIQEIHILCLALLILVGFEVVRYVRGKTFAQFLSDQWLVFRWAVIIAVLFICIVFGYYGSGFNSENFIYLQF